MSKQRLAEESNQKTQAKGGLGAKIAVGVASAALVFGSGIGIAKLVDSKKAKQDGPVGQPEVSTQTNNAQAQVTTTSDGQESSGAITESQIEGTESSIEETKADLRYMSAYADLLLTNKSMIQQYIIQYGVDYSGYIEKPLMEPTPIALTDITGDAIPELIYMDCEGETNEVGTLHIWTMNEDGTAREIYNQGFDYQVAGGTGYLLFKVQGENSLYGYNSMSDEFYEGGFYRFEMDGNGSLVQGEPYLSMSSGPNADYTDTVSEYSYNGSSITEAEYEKYQQELLDSASELIMYNSNYKSEDMANSMKSHTDIKYMSCGQALRYFAVIEPTADNPMPFAGDKHFDFSSGVGGWGTGMIIHPDGTFEGDFHDSDMGVSGDGYEATVYLCAFHGRFKDIKKINENTYSMTLDYFDTDQTPEETWIADQTRYIAAEPYGIDGGTTFYLYLPGTAVAELPEEYVSWCYGLSDLTTLPYFGFYNVEQQNGFSGE